MFTVFVIGNIASGKSTAARHLAQAGGRLIDLDEVAKGLYEPGSRLVADLRDAFGSEIIDVDGGIDRRALAQRAFASPEATEQLNALVHPAVKQRLEDLLAMPENPDAMRSPVSWSVVEISVARSFADVLARADEVIAITAPVEVRCARAVARGMDEHDFWRRAAAQPTESELCALATRVIDNQAGDDSLFAALDAWLVERGLDGSVRATGESHA